jgi:hypothetical protein
MSRDHSVQTLLIILRYMGRPAGTPGGATAWDPIRAQADAGRSVAVPEAGH